MSSFPPDVVPIRRLYERLTGSSISSVPAPQVNIARVLTAKAVSAEGGSGGWFWPSMVFK